MFVAIPLENKPSWRNPPWLTVLLIVVNCLIFWVWQTGEQRAVERAAIRYAVSPLPQLEMPAFVAHLKTQAQEAPPRQAKRAQAMASMAANWLSRAHYSGLYEMMWQEQRFRRQLLAGRVLTGDSPQHAQWQDARAAFTPTEPAPFTSRWAYSYEPGDGWQPLQALTSTFLHGSTGHLLGNMVFLFLFGFTLELTLGRLPYLIFYLLCGYGASLMAHVFYSGMGGLGLGASGAISGLMAMYVVLYRMRRIRFFYMLGPYFNYAQWPALAVLPVWMGLELGQHLMGGQQVAYMAHLGGLLCGAVLMAAFMHFRRMATPEAPEASADARQSADLREAVTRARRLTESLDMPRAIRAWRAAARLAPDDPQVLGHWFDAARHEPAGEDFHAAARRIFKLGATTPQERALQHRAWRSYTAQAKPHARISTDTQHKLARNFIRQAEWDDAERVCEQLASQPDHPEWPATLTRLTSGLARSERLNRARHWLPVLERDAPGDPVTRWLQQQGA